MYALSESTMVGSVSDLRASDAEYTPRASALGIELRTDAPALTIQTDPDLLIRVVRNLVDNAHKFTTRGYVEISARTVLPRRGAAGGARAP